MKLRRPTDFLILEALDERGRNVATNLAHHTGKSRKNVNTRMPVLDDYGLVEKIGPAEHSGLYELTEKGRLAIELRAEYDRDGDFGALLEKAQARAPFGAQGAQERALSHGGDPDGRT